MIHSVSMVSETHALKCELAAEVLRRYGKLRLQVNGWSMFPAVRPGDVLIVDRTGRSEVVEGDIILFTRERGFFAHRLVRNGSARLLTRGDAMPNLDPAIAENELLGKVSFIVRNDRHIRPPRRPSISGRVVGMLMRRSVMVARVIAGIHGICQVHKLQQPKILGSLCHS